MPPSVLLIDDEPLIGRALARLLGPDWATTTVVSGPSALARVDAGERYDVVLCDLAMPGMDGVAVYEQLALRHPDVASRVVFLTGGAQSSQARSLLALVPNLTLEKPVRLLDLERAFTTVMAEHGDYHPLVASR
jgi:CheY-like chemotaxis protein